MPTYDRQCPDCGWIAIDLVEPVHVEAVRCPSCGAETQRAWLTKATTIIPDEIDHIQRNGTRDPIHFRSRQDLIRWRKQHGYEVNDSHVGEPGSDKSKHTMKWQSYDPYTAANVKELLERAFAAPASEPDRDTFHVEWYDADGTPSGRRESVTR
jgi:hypothetical protein